MSDKFYAVQFRSMHTAIHSIAVFSLQQKAEELLAFMKAEERMPDDFEFEFEPCNFVDMYEINFRNQPYTHGDPDDVDSMPLVYVNYPETDIPDVYGY
jgi:hypothetical protein